MKTMIKMTKLLAFVLLLTALLMLFASCQSRPKTASESFFLMDTVITVTLYEEPGEKTEEVFTACRELLSKLDGEWAREKEGSLIAGWNASEAGGELNAESAELLTRALKIARLTEGAFDPTLASLTDLWKQAGERNELPGESELSGAMAKTGYEKLTLEGNLLTKSSPGIAVDLGGIGKGGAVDLLLALLDGYGLSGGLISFGSNVAGFGSKPDGSPFRIALRDPKNASGSVGTFSLTGGEILSVSGDYERYVSVNGVRYHHILDPDTGYPSASGLSSVAVVTGNGAEADALSTALLVMGKEKAMALYDSKEIAFEAVFVTDAGEIFSTPGIADRFETR